LRETAPDASRLWGRLKRRAEFQRAGKGRRVGGAALTLQANARVEGDPTEGPRFGLTVTKKTGNSPARNRIRRRFREAMRRISALDAKADHDYVLMARREALGVAFDALVAEIAGAIRRVGAGRSVADRRPHRDGRP
jgi:ribonuclease P protein component